MNELNDISLVTQVAVFHNRRAFDRLVVKYQSPIRRFFLNQTLGDRQLSDDLAQGICEYHQVPGTRVVLHLAL